MISLKIGLQSLEIQLHVALLFIWCLVIRKERDCGWWHSSLAQVKREIWQWHFYCREKKVTWHSETLIASLCLCSNCPYFLGCHCCQSERLAGFVVYSGERRTIISPNVYYQAQWASVRVWGRAQNWISDWGNSIENFLILSKNSFFLL